ncbi:MAG: flagellar cap protein FliD N-terminal domain-containing protein, partial [Phycisphaerae bacterium]
MTVTSSIGPISGIDYGKLIDGLMGIEQRPLDQTNKLLTSLKSQSDAFLSLSAQMTGLKLAATNFTSSAIFRSTTATSSNPNILSATSNLSAPVGSYAFTVQRLAAASQLATQGFASATTAIGTSGVVPITSQDLALNKPLKLATLNGGAGVASGSIQINTADGASKMVDLSAAVTIQDVVDRINGAGANVTAAIKGDKLTLVDGTTGGNTLNITNVSGGTTATDLGLTQVVAQGNTLTGADINRLALTTSLSNLNGGNGVRTTGTSATDFTITTNLNGTVASFSVALNGANTLGDVINKINTAATSGGKQSVFATLDPNGHSIKLANSNGGTVAVTANNNSLAARDLGLTGVTSTAGVLTGQRINAGLNSALLRELNNGSGVGLGTVKLTNGNGEATNVDLTGSSTVQDLLDKINAQTGTTSITASVNSAGNALQLVDASGGPGFFSA